MCWKFLATAFIGTAIFLIWLFSVAITGALIHLAIFAPHEAPDSFCILVAFVLVAQEAALTVVLWKTLNAMDRGINGDSH